MPPPPSDPPRGRNSDHTLPIDGSAPGVASTEFQLVSEGPSELGDYELLEELGAGGMGRVYRAKHRGSGRVVALKTLLPRYLSTPALVQRFKKEAEAAAHLDHPGIVPVYRFDEADGQCFFTMALVDGHGLDQRLRQGPLDNRPAARVVQRVAEAVAYAHRRGVVHRDLKPGNILIDRAGALKVTDFGLARRLGEEDLTGLDDSVVASNPDKVATVIQQTKAGSIVGTPGYLAPEQATAGAQVGPAADVWALGAVLYACLTGRPPFVGADAVETVMLTTETDPVPPDEINPDVDPDLAEICLRCLRKNPAERFPSADAVAAELARWLEGQSAPTPWEQWLARAARFLAAAPELVPLLTGLVVHRLGNIQEGLFAGCALAAVGTGARRAGRGPVLMPLVSLAVFWVALAVVAPAMAVLPLLTGAFVSAFGLQALLVLLACWLMTAETGRPGKWRAKRVGLGCLVAGALMLAPSIAAALGAERVRDVDAGWGSAVIAAERVLGRVSGWLLAVPLGLAAGSWLAQVNRRLDRWGREAFPAFALGAALAAAGAALALHELRPDEPTQAARFNAAGPGPALAVADVLVAERIDSTAEARQAGAAGTFCLKLSLLLIPMAAGGAAAGLAIRSTARGR